MYADQRGLPIIPLLPVASHPVPFHLIATQPIACEDYAAGLAHLVEALARLPKTTPGGTTPPGPADRAAEMAYLDFVLSEMNADLRTARYVNLGAEQAQPARRTPAPSGGGLPGEFDLVLERLVKAECIRGEEFDRPGEPVDDARVPLRAMRRAILLGDPGSGKTTTLLQLAVEMAQEAKADPARPLPVFVPLRSYAGDEPFGEFVRRQLGPLQSRYERLAGEGRLVLLCDALNEMQRSGNGRDLVDEVRRYLRDRAPWVVSCRVRDYQEELKDLPDVGKVRLKPLDLPRIKQVIDRRFGAEPGRAAALWADLKGSDDLLAAWRAFEAAGKAGAFWEREWPGDIGLGFVSDQESAWREMHRDRRRMMLLCRSPFMLFMVCGTFERLGALPPNRGALFATFVDNLLRREEQASRATGRAWIDAAVIRQALAALAFAMQKSDTGTEITRAAAESIVQSFSISPRPEGEGPGVRADPALLLRLAASASLLDVGERVRYTHQLLQEYFAGEVMGAAMDAGRAPTEFWPPEAWWEPQGWEETAAILAGVRGDPEGVARWIAPAQPEVAYRALTESGVEVDLDGIQPETRAALVDGATAKTNEANPVGRAAAYRVLGRFRADARPGVLVSNGMPDLVWCKVPAGRFQMGGDPEAVVAWDGGEFELDYPFWIGKYPVTVAPYEAFVDAGGYRERRYWTGAGWEWKGDRTEPRRWGEPEWRIANHPVVGVSWYEAYAYTQWLEEQRRRGRLVLPGEVPAHYVIRLARECEWEKVARHPDGRRWPWGDEWEEGRRVNWGGSGIGRTSAVGIFPEGANPAHGACDLVGNVWEWCLTGYRGKYGSPGAEHNDPAGDAGRCARGGSWSYFEYGCRAAARHGFFPRSWLDILGLRVVVSVPI